MTTAPVNIPPIEDEIEKAWEKFQRKTDRQDDPLDHRIIFEAGFRAARTVSADIFKWSRVTNAAAGGIT